MPMGEACIILNLRDDPLRLYDNDELDHHKTYSLAMLSGAHSEPFVIDNQQQGRVFGVQFRAGGAFPFFRVPASETTNLAVPLDALWRISASEFRERLLAASSIRIMFQIAESVMLAQAVRVLDFHPAVNYSLALFSRLPHTRTVIEITNRTGLSQRRFIEVFHDQVGLTPKAFCRVRRFQYVLQTIHGAQHVNWANVALDSGYYDQAHFIHDFRSFSGLTPGQYWESRTPHQNHVPIS